LLSILTSLEKNDKRLKPKLKSLVNGITPLNWFLVIRRMGDLNQVGKERAEILLLTEKLKTEV
jgi:hypothetical protein